MLWTATHLTWYLDGRALMSAPVYASTNQPMFLLLQMWTGGWTSDPDATTPTTIETQIDYVRAWQEVGLPLAAAPGRPCGRPAPPSDSEAGCPRT